jgi:DegV family protein with EDD domain
MEKIGLLIDSTTLTRPGLEKKPYIKVAPLNVTIDGVDHTEFELSTEAMIANLHSGKKMTTSQPAPGVFLELFEAFHKEGFTHVFVITLSERVSGTHQSAVIAKGMLEVPLEVKVYAPKVASYGVANGIPTLCKDIERGVSFDSLVKHAYSLYDNAAVMFTLGDLMHLFRGGRLNKVQALLGSVLRIKPIIEMVEGKLELTKKERTNQACYEYFMEKVRFLVAGKKHIALDVIELNRKEWGDKLEEDLRKEFPNAAIYRTDYVSPVFFVHLGDAGFGVAVVAE